MSGAGNAGPVIGITAYFEQARWGAWDRQAALVPSSYVEMVVAAGGVPVLLPPVAGIEAAVGRLDGLIISGGPDVDPVRYGQVAHPQTDVRPERDAAEIALFNRSLALGLPVLGICRGMQVMNVALGGTLFQHLPDVVGHDGHSPTPGTMAEHPVTVETSSCLAGLLGGALRPAVPTHHHQGVDKLGDGLVASAWAGDGTIEAFELEAGDARRQADGERAFVIGVQWHPEAGADPSLFLALVAAAATRSRE